MVDLSEPRRSSRTNSGVARILGPLALILALIAVVVVVSSSSGGSDPSTTDQGATTAKSENKSGPETPRDYVIEAGDSLTSIAEKFGVSTKRLERLNPDIDPQTLAEGTSITLR